MSTSQHLYIFSYLKQSDLTCQSARSAITHYLGYTQLTGLKHYRLWDIASDPAYTLPPSRVHDLLNKTFSIINPNKEGYYLDSLPALPPSSDSSTYCLKVYPKNPSSSPSLLSKIEQFLDVPLLSVTSSILWELTLGTSSPAAKDDLLHQVVVTSSIEKGLLVNPIYESFDLLSAESFR